MAHAAGHDGDSAAVKSADRVLSILELLTQTETPLTFTEIGRRLGYPRSSLHGLLRTLVDRGWLDLDPLTRCFRLGIRTYEAGSLYLRTVDVVERARPVMDGMRDLLDETVQLAVLDGRFNVYMAKSDCSHALTLASDVGRRLAAHATALGKVMLADLDQAELDRLLDGVRLEAFTANTITDRRRLATELKRVRSQGFADDDQEYTVGVRCVAVPVRDHAGSVVAAMSVSVPMVRFDEAVRRHALEALLGASAELSRALGYPLAG